MLLTYLLRIILTRILVLSDLSCLMLVHLFRKCLFRAYISTRELIIWSCLLLLLPLPVLILLSNILWIGLLAARIEHSWRSLWQCLGIHPCIWALWIVLQCRYEGLVYGERRGVPRLKLIWHVRVRVVYNGVVIFWLFVRVRICLLPLWLVLRVHIRR